MKLFVAPIVFNIHMIHFKRFVRWFCRLKKKNIISFSVMLPGKLWNKQQVNLCQKAKISYFTQLFHIISIKY